MGYACYEHNGRDQGYGVPAKCDHPGCDKDIDRGIGYACGSDPMENCGLFFFGEHSQHDKTFVPEAEQERHDWGVCERCAKEYAEPFEPSPDTQEWIDHKMTDPTWQQWRDENPEWVAAHTT